MPPPPKPPATKPPPAVAATPTTTVSPKSFKVAPLTDKGGDRIVIYGTGGIGKTSLAAHAPNPVFIDLDHGAAKVGGVNAVEGIHTFEHVRGALQQLNIWAGCDTVVIDSATAAQELAVQHTLKTVRHEKGHFVDSIEGYGFGKGYQFAAETFRLLLSDLDAHRSAGRNVVLVCHSTTAYAPNPAGDDFLRNEPDLFQPPKTGRLRDVVKNWCDHMVFIDYDKIVKDGKATGCGTRTLYTQEMPHYWAKSRSLDEPIPYAKGDGTFWTKLLGAKSE